MTNSSVAEEIAEILLSINGVTFSAAEPYRFTSGLLSPVYVDNRLLMSYPNERRRVVDAWVELIRSVGEFDAIAGTATAGIPHAAWISDKMDLPMVYVRGKAKEHGKKSQIEGLLQGGQKVVIVEDLISTGKSSLESQRAIREQGGIADDIVAIFSHTLPQSNENIQQASGRLATLTTFPTVVDIAVRKKQIQPSDREMVLDWLNDSANWGRRHGFE